MIRKAAYSGKSFSKFAILKKSCAGEQDFFAVRAVGTVFAVLKMNSGLFFQD
jgi:hypothetical protein